MNSINAIIIDDEQPGIKMLTWLLQEYCPEVNILASTEDPLKGIELINKLKPHLVFLDIEMPVMNGFDLLKRFEENLFFKVIFTTAYDQYAIKAIKFSALDYLLKPIDKDELIQAIQKVKIEEPIRQEQLGILQHSLKSDLSKIALSSSDGVEIVFLEEILYCESESNYTFIFFKNGSKKVFTKTLKYIEETIDSAQFLRVHKSYLINLNYLKRYIKGEGGDVEMEDGKMLPVARNKKQQLMDYLGL